MSNPIGCYSDDMSFNLLPGQIQVRASSRWSFRPNSAWSSIETTTIGKMHPTLVCRILSNKRSIVNGIYSFLNPIKYWICFIVAEKETKRKSGNLDIQTVPSYLVKCDGTDTTSSPWA